MWEGVAARLRTDGHEVVVARLPPSSHTVDQARAGFLAALPDGPVVLVPHSNAGLYVAGLAASRGDDVRGMVFCDALLPGPGERTPTTSSDFRDFLSSRADADGMLPPWTRWWPEEEVAALVPDAATLKALRVGEPRLPLSYFEETVPTPAGWAALPASYLAFGDTYEQERAEAEHRGWPVVTLPGRHLHPLVDPSGVAGALGRLLGGLGIVNEFP